MAPTAAAALRPPSAEAGPARSTTRRARAKRFMVLTSGEMDHICADPLTTALHQPRRPPAGELPVTTHVDPSPAHLRLPQYPTEGPPCAGRLASAPIPGRFSCRCARPVVHSARPGHDAPALM